MTLVDFVYADLCTHLDSMGVPPCKLTYSALSKHYEMSLTPIRAAVKRLVSEDYLTPLDNGRLRVNPDRPRKRKSRKAPEPQRPASRDDEIRIALIRQSLRGNRDFVREEAFASQFGIGRTALRPILSRLVGEGILEHVQRCGWRVHSFSNSDLHSFLEVRELLEVRALELAFPKLASNVLEEFLEQNQAGQLGETGNPRNNLHGYWIHLSENRYIEEILLRQSVYHRVLLDYAAPAAHVVDEMATQHCDILIALLEENKSQARRSLVKHIRAQKPIVTALMEELREEDATSEDSIGGIAG